MPRTAIDPEIRSRAKALRKNATPQERRVWQRLREINKLGISRFRRQAPIGRYIADFACFRTRIVVEIDGSQHVDSEMDGIRDHWLRNEGFRVLRFWNTDVNDNLDGVAEAIALAARTPPPAPPHEGEGSAPHDEEKTK